MTRLVSHARARRPLRVARGMSPPTGGRARPHVVAGGGETALSNLCMARHSRAATRKEPEHVRDASLPRADRRRGGGFRLHRSPQALLYHLANTGDAPSLAIHTGSTIHASSMRSSRRRPALRRVLCASPSGSKTPTTSLPPSPRPSNRAMQRTRRDKARADGRAFGNANWTKR